jgi:hypothetical protein
MDVITLAGSLDVPLNRARSMTVFIKNARISFSPTPLSRSFFDAAVNAGQRERATDAIG